MPKSRASTVVRGVFILSPLTRLLRGMSADDLFAPDGAFATDWLAQGDPQAFDTSTASGASFDPDSLAFLSNNPFGGLDGDAGTTTKGMNVALTQDELARALMGGFDVGGERVGELSSAGTSTVGGRSDAGSSPYSSGLSHQSAPGTSNGQFDFDAALGTSPPFALPHNLACDFDTSALQELFTNSSPTTTAGINAHLSPYPPAPLPFQTRSPASSVSPYAAPLPAFPHQPLDNHASSTFNPAQLFAPSPSTGPSPAAPRLSVDFASPMSSFSSFSPPVTVSAPLPTPQQQTQQPSFTSLAATAGIAVPTLHAASLARAAPSGFGPGQDAATSAALSTGARGRTTRNRISAQPAAVASGMSGEAANGQERARSPMEAIANAGLQSGVHQARACSCTRFLCRATLRLTPSSGRSSPPAQSRRRAARLQPRRVSQGAVGRGSRRRARRAKANSRQRRQEGQEVGSRSQCVASSRCRGRETCS